MEDMNMPVIGIALDWQEQGTFSQRPHYALREHYFQAVQNAGGIAMAVPHHIKQIDAYLEKVDGLIVPGGEFASPEEWYINAEEKSPYAPSPRMEFDRTLIERALAKNLPLLGICAGMQFLGCLYGCKMVGNVHDYMHTDINHWDGAPCEDTAHTVSIEKGTLLDSIVSKSTINVNSHHQEALVEVGKEVVVCAKAPDGVVEAIELPQYQFALGIQWHPEYEVTQEDKAIFRALVEAAAI